MSKTSCPPAPRTRCPQCQRAQRTCICALAQPVEHGVQVLILQHPMEVHEAKGTGRLLQLSLPHSRLLVGEQFDAAELQAALHQPWAASVDIDTEPRQALLLYPETTEQDAALQLLPAAPLPAHWPCPPRLLRLVVIDGTWRKSRKMLYLNPALQALPRLALKDVPASGYAIRKAHLPGQLSSFEATVQALAQLEDWTAQTPETERLAAVFSRFIAQQRAQADERARP
ncbi:tRNA-uridine aminocarboxypropyltransferase [Comamonas sp. lk]|uniref:tRNA-uridine aminocarboxypropyltransferase n=1 Tax=Comamonas sp. lk TaxID=2201272 RepID=UPI000EAF2788|nr:tRNA-uridine aminocarboxypropyltransferase [Comamonas sp. lk]